MSQLIIESETGFLVPGNDHVALANSLGNLLSDNVLRNRLGERAAEYAEAYSWPSITEQIIRLYKDVIKRS